MRRRIQIVLVFVLGAAFCWVALHIIREREPVYQGKTLSIWLDEGRQHDWMSRSAEAAVNTMGSRAVPALINMVQVKDSEIRRVLIILSSRHEWLDIHIRTRQEMLEMADYGFRLLGPAAKTAVPDLVRLLYDKDPETRCMAAHCLGEIGLDAAGALSDLVEYVAREQRCRTNSEWDEKGIFCAAYTLGRIGPAACPTIPLLMSLTNDPTWYIRSSAHTALIQLTGISLEPIIAAISDPSNQTNWGEECAVVGALGSRASNAIPALINVAEKGNWHFQEKAIEILGKIHARPGVSIPAIVPFLQSTNSFVRFHTLVALGEFGTNTQGLVPTPDIIRALADSDDWVRRAATNTLLYLSPQAAAKAGVPLNP